MWPPNVRRALALCLILCLPGCVLPWKRPSAPRQSLPVACAPAALTQCEGLGVTLPTRISADTAGMVAELALRALIACAQRHDELRECVRKHNSGK